MHASNHALPAIVRSAAVRRIALLGTFIALTFAALGSDAVTLTAVLSRKAHGTGNFDIAIDTTQSIGGSVTVESRAIGGGHLIVFQFDGPVISFGMPTAFDEAGAPFGEAIALAGTNNDVVVTLTGVPDNKRVRVMLPNVNGAGDAAASLGFLVGDVNNSRFVATSDVTQMKARAGQGVDATNARFDLNVTGAITAADISAVKGRSPRTLPDASNAAATFTTQPGNVTLSAGQSAQFVVAVGGTPAPTLQWQMSTDGGVNWGNIAGATNSVFNVVGATVSQNGFRFRVVATNTSGAINSAVAMLTVNAATLVSIALAPTNPNILNGTTRQFFATGTYSDATTQNLTATTTWSSNPPSIAFISNAAGSQGLATGVGVGSTIIMATSGAITANTMLTVRFNSPPVAVDDSAATTQDTALILASATLVANDFDPDGGPLNVVAVQNAVNGTVVLFGGTVIFTPAAGFIGFASFVYTVSDGVFTDVGVVNVIVSPA